MGIYQIVKEKTNMQSLVSGGIIQIDSGEIIGEILWWQLFNHESKYKSQITNFKQFSVSEFRTFVIWKLWFVCNFEFGNWSLFTGG